MLSCIFPPSKLIRENGMLHQLSTISGQQGLPPLVLQYPRASTHGLTASDCIQALIVSVCLHTLAIGSRNCDVISGS
jgi:hypothetical protein